jgi:hypothetical protein
VSAARRKASSISLRVTARSKVSVLPSVLLIAQGVKVSPVKE